MVPHAVRGRVSGVRRGRAPIRQARNAASSAWPPRDGADRPPGRPAGRCRTCRHRPGTSIWAGTSPKTPLRPPPRSVLRGHLVVRVSAARRSETHLRSHGSRAHRCCGSSSTGATAAVPRVQSNARHSSGMTRAPTVGHSVGMSTHSAGQSLSRSTEVLAAWSADARCSR